MGDPVLVVHDHGCSIVGEGGAHIGIGGIGHQLDLCGIKMLQVGIELLGKYNGQFDLSLLKAASISS